MVSKIDVPLRTIVRIVLVVAVIWLLGRLWTQVLLLIIAAMLAAAFDPWVKRLMERGWSRGRAVALFTAAAIAVVALLIVLVVPSLIEQASRLAENLPGYVEDLQGLLGDHPQVRDWLRSQAQQGAADPGELFSGVLSAGTSVISGVANLVILFVLTVYLLLDGDRVFNALVNNLSPGRRSRAVRVRDEVSRVVGGYIVGQSIVSSLFGIFAFVTMNIAGTPEPLLLAVMAAFLDAVPMIGATVATIPVVLLTLTVSTPAALVMLLLFIAYQQFENYVIVPRAFRNTLQISSLTVLIAVLIGSSLLGIVGVFLALPTAAAIPALLTIWNEERADQRADHSHGN